MANPAAVAFLSRTWLTIPMTIMWHDSQKQSTDVNQLLTLSIFVYNQDLQVEAGKQIISSS